MDPSGWSNHAMSKNVNTIVSLLDVLRKISSMFTRSLTSENRCIGMQFSFGIRGGQRERVKWYLEANVHRLWYLQNVNCHLRIKMSRLVEKCHNFILFLVNLVQLIPKAQGLAHDE